MHVHEERLGEWANGPCEEGLRSWNPLVLEAVGEFARSRGSAAEATKAGSMFALLLDLDCADVRVSLAVAASALHEAMALPLDAIHLRMARLAAHDPLLGLAFQALSGFRPAGDARSVDEREDVERVLYLVARSAQVQEDVDALEALAKEEAMT